MELIALPPERLRTARAILIFYEISKKDFDATETRCVQQ